MTIVNDIRTADQLSTVVVEEAAIRGNTAIRVSFPKDDSIEVFFVNDPGTTYWNRNLMTIMVNNREHGDVHLLDYIEDGQDAYGSDPIAIDQEGHVCIRRVRSHEFKRITNPTIVGLPFKLSDFEDDDEVVNASELIMESGWDADWIAFDGTKFLEADAVILSAVVKDETGLDFLNSNAQTVPPLTAESVI